MTLKNDTSIKKEDGYQHENVKEGEQIHQQQCSLCGGIEHSSKHRNNISFYQGNLPKEFKPEQYIKKKNN